MSGLSNREWRDEIRRRLEPLKLPPTREAEIVEEVAQHLDDRYRELRASGRSDEDAAAIAWRELDETDVLGREVARVEARAPLNLPPPGAPPRGRWLGAFWQDVRYALRTLGRSPGFSLTVLLAVALSIGPTTAILSIGNWLLWRPHPGVTDSGRLAEVWVGRWNEAGTSVRVSGLSYGEIEEISTRSTTTVGIAGGQEMSASLSVHGVMPRMAATANVTANFFDVLGVRMRAGRAFLPEEDRLSGPPVAIISERLSESAFGAPEAALAKTISLNSRPFSVAGVVASAFGGTSPMGAVDVWIPGAAYGYMNHWPTPLSPSFHTFVIRMAPGTAPSTVESELTGLIRALRAEASDRSTDVSARVFPGLGVHPLQRARTRATVRTMLIVGAVLLLIGCANVANLLVLRTTRRAHEIGVRKALGATRLRVVQVQVMEACLLAIGGASVGLGLAVFLKELMQHLLFPQPPGIAFAVPLDGRVMAATTAAAILAGVVSAAAPAWLAARGGVLSPTGRTGARTSTRAPSLRGALAALQLALSLMLLVGALLLVSTLRNLRAVDLGFDPTDITVLPVDLAGHGYTPERALQYFRTVLPALQAHGEFDSVTLAQRAPFGPGSIVRVQPPDGNDLLEVRTNGITEAYFDLLATPLLRGRSFTSDESFAPPGADPPVVVNETLAMRLYATHDVVGRTVRFARTRANPVRDLLIIGVVQDAHWNDITGTPEPFLYQPLGRNDFGATRGQFMVKSALPASRVADIAGEIAARVDSSVPFVFARPLTSGIDRGLAEERLFAWVLSLLAALGFLLASFGLYGLVGQTVAERAREFGIRVALGATRRDIARLVARYALAVTAGGVMAGLGLAWIGTRAVDRLLFGVTRLDPAIYVAAVITLVAVVALACVAPVRRATRVQPVEVLRAE
ncbi:MAG: ABC transporter permease [Vicinamibacterales bacterium]